MRQPEDGHRALGNPRAVPARGARAGLALALLLPHVVGCFHYVPVSSPAVTTGTRVEVGITDRGRVALTEPVGPGVRRIEGHVLASTDSSLALSLATVEFIDLSIPMKMRGERLEISRDHITELRERRLSKTRSWIAAALIVAGGVAASLIGIKGFGADPGSDRPDGDGSQQ